MRILGSAGPAASCLLSLLLAFWPHACPAALEPGGSLALTTDDIYRGISQTCGHPAAQADAHVRERGASDWALFAGVWGSAGLGRSPCGGARELDAYLGYSLALTPDLSATLTYIHNGFPGGDYANPHLLGKRYDYDQLGMTWDIAERLYLTLSWTPDALQYERYDERYEDAYRSVQNRSALAYGAEWRQPLLSGLSLTAGVGYDRMADPFGTGYGFWSLGLTHEAGPLELDLGYFRTADRAVRLFGPDSAGGRVSASVLWRF
jgi:uncharacterized protein (TIGR02001 family)